MGKNLILSIKYGFIALKNQDCPAKGGHHELLKQEKTAGRQVLAA